jgi:hypothetical protein
MPDQAALGFVVLALAVPCAATDRRTARIVGGSLAGLSLLAALFPLAWRAAAASGVVAAPAAYGATFAGLLFSLAMLILSAAILALALRRRMAAAGLAVLGLSCVLGAFAFGHLAGGAASVLRQVEPLVLLEAALLLAAVLLALDEPEPELTGL